MRTGERKAANHREARIANKGPPDGRALAPGSSARSTLLDGAFLLQTTCCHDVSLGRLASRSGPRVSTTRKRPSLHDGQRSSKRCPTSSPAVVKPSGSPDSASWVGPNRARQSASLSARWQLLTNP